MLYKLFSALLISLFFFTCQNIEAQQNTAKSDAFKESYHQFDFWIGNWKVYKFGTDTLVGISKIQSINDSTALLENYHTPENRYKGKSLNTYNRKTGNWEQFWIDNTGLIL